MATGLLVIRLSRPYKFILLSDASCPRELYEKGRFRDVARVACTTEDRVFLFGYKVASSVGKCSSKFCKCVMVKRATKGIKEHK